LWNGGQPTCRAATFQSQDAYGRKKSVCLFGPIKEEKDMNEISAEAKELEWKNIFRIGGVSGLIVTAFFLIDMVVLVAFSPYPATASAWFDLLRTRRLVGILSLDIFVLAGFPFC
jgi:hypothetical protein